MNEHEDMDEYYAEIKTAIEERIAVVDKEITFLVTKLRQKVESLESRIESLEAASEANFSAHARIVEFWDKPIARLQEQLRDKDSDLYRLEQEISHMKSGLQRSQRGW